MISWEIGKSIKGIVIGDFSDFDAKENENVTSSFKTVKETFEDRLKHFDIPIISNIACGHEPCKMTIAHGVRVHIDTNKKIFKTLENFLV